MISLKTIDVCPQQSNNLAVSDVTSFCYNYNSSDTWSEIQMTNGCHRV